MAAIEIELGENSLAAIRALTDALKALELLRAQGGREGNGKRVDMGAWMRMTDICKALGISPPTVRKRANEGLIEVRYFGEKSPRYRLAEGAGQNEDKRTG